jgi:hypothetical protein
MMRPPLLWRFFGLIALGVTMAVCVACAGGIEKVQEGNATESPKATATPKVKPSTPTPVPMNFTMENWAQVIANPEKYKGAHVSITGRVFTDTEVDNNVFCFQMWTDPEDSEGNTGVCTETDEGVAKDDYLRIEGELYGKVEGTNAFGASLTIPLVLAAELDKISRSEAVAPTLAVVNVNASQVQHGLKITLDRVEIAATETRVWVTVMNGATNNASIYTFDAKLVQGSRQMETKSIYGTDLAELPDEILPGIETQGVLVFEPIDPAAKQARLVWDGPRTDSYELDFAAWIWDFNW